MIKIGDRVSLKKAQDEGHPAYVGVVSQRLNLEDGTRFEVRFDNGIIRCVDDGHLQHLV